MVYRVAVVGAGPAGLTAVRWCLQENLVPTCFEKADAIGGLWHITDGDDDRTTVMSCTVANISKELTAMSDVPPPESLPVYLTGRRLLEYLQLYARQHDLEQYVQLNTEVICIEEAADHAQTGQWTVRTRRVKGKHDASAEHGYDDVEQTFDAVIVGSGVMAKPYIPEFPNLQNFQGRILHSKHYKSWAGFEGRRVLVVGAGNSAADVACDISTVAEQVYLSTRNGLWLGERRAARGRPFDMILSRFTNAAMHYFPSLLNKVIAKQLNAKFDHELYGLCPKVAPFQSTTCLSDELSYKLMTGKVKIKKCIKCFTKTGVEFVDGDVIDTVDDVIFATGYKPDFPFLSDGILGEDKTQMFLTMFPLNRKYPTLVFPGCFRMKGPILVAIEMQNRYAAKILKGTLKLPSQGDMHNWVEANNEQSRKWRSATLVHASQVDYVPFMDDIATRIGCKPRIGWLLLTDPRLALRCLFRACTSYQFRLHGPDAWKGAKAAIMGQDDRTFSSFREGHNRDGGQQEPNRHWLRWLMVVGLLAAFVSKVLM
ncbi:dimethylaniline monooxygenase [N-oxide-forming] 2-like [Mya arenaria]|uniref:dimethylaniline monooxygenase [N-oxide-forming] 2-like n=1 Tax=Mya arenaria TaxID=6604 RepID=UPI0022E586E0|nr:dimethylaniline monooxygenase [N-oxide-forming] 2-like [Mya arenaria]XP_052808127.1 dimethylaniline monooxygenase [N-oxide-forming] 2-like [Mya arenaria]XP_052808128.1 dimethylaniline monooxygenase [N-oxide-forming] 2-like [Mya arenaria]